MPPKTKKRLGSKKSPIKHENNCETLNNPFIDTSTKKGMHMKPLATSSPLDESFVCTKNCVKNVAINTATVMNERNNKILHNSKKRLNVNGIRGVNKANTAAKISKRKVSDLKESKQTEKQQCTTDPQTLLNNLDLDKFLTSVHGPA